MKKDEQIFFSSWFQIVYDHLAIFSYMSASILYAGVKKTEYLAQTQLISPDTESVISLLTSNGIIDERVDLLFLNKNKFFQLSIWDLLVICEPWLQQGSPPGLPESDDSFVEFFQSTKLFTSFMDIPEQIQ